MPTTYTPVPYVYRETIDEEITKGARGKIFFYDDKGEVNSKEGQVTGTKDIDGKGLFISLDNSKLIRVDTIITLFGKPGAAYEAYDANANSCMDCTGGYPL
jgi:hypothetical protein